MTNFVELKSKSHGIQLCLWLNCTSYVNGLQKDYRRIFDNVFEKVFKKVSKKVFEKVFEKVSEM